MSDKAPGYAILWASQTGNAEWIAKAIHKEAQTRGFTGECFVMNEFELVSSLCYSLPPVKSCNRRNS
jgi:flavodoxin